MKPLRDGGEKELERIFNKIKEECKNDEYDCALGISGGVDSCYLLHMCKKYNLRVLAMHVDAGWNSELAVSNIEKMCIKLGYELHTIVMDWPTMKELQRAYMFSGLGNLDVPQDHCYIAATRQMCKKMKIKYLLNGWNLATEGILSHAFQQSPWDWKNIKAVYKRCGRKRISLKKYYHANFVDQYIRYQYMYPVKQIMPLCYIEYSKKHAIEVLEEEYDWQYYGGKHYESRFTKFFQEVYLPQKYGWEKRRDHISSLIVGGELNREDGLNEMLTPTATEEQLLEETEYVLKKLDISNAEWEEILKAPCKSVDDYPNDTKMFNFCRRIKYLFAK